MYLNKAKAVSKFQFFFFHFQKVAINKTKLPMRRNKKKKILECKKTNPRSKQTSLTDRLAKGCRND